MTFTVRHGFSMAHRNRWFTGLPNLEMVIFHGELWVITRWYILRIVFFWGGGGCSHHIAWFRGNMTSPRKYFLVDSMDWFSRENLQERKAPYLMGKSMVSCRFSLKPIHWLMVSAGNHLKDCLKPRLVLLKTDLFVLPNRSRFLRSVMIMHPKWIAFSGTDGTC